MNRAKTAFGVKFNFEQCLKIAGSQFDRMYSSFAFGFYK